MPVGPPLALPETAIDGKFCDIHSPQRMKPTEFSSSATGRLTFVVQSEILTTVEWITVEFGADIYGLCELWCSQL